MPQWISHKTSRHLIIFRSSALVMQNLREHLSWRCDALHKSNHYCLINTSGIRRYELWIFVFLKKLSYPQWDYHHSKQWQRQTWNIFFMDASFMFHFRVIAALFVRLRFEFSLEKKLFCDVDSCGGLYDQIDVTFFRGKTLPPRSFKKWDYTRCYDQLWLGRLGW